MKTKNNATLQPVDHEANLVELVIMVNLAIWSVIRGIVYPGVGVQLHFL